MSKQKKFKSIHSRQRNKQYGADSHFRFNSDYNLSPATNNQQQVKTQPQQWLSSKQALAGRNYHQVSFRDALVYGSSDHTVKSTAIKSGHSAAINFYKNDTNSKSKSGGDAHCFMSSEGKQNRLGASDGRFLQNPSSYKSKESGREYQHQGQLRNRSDQHHNIVVASEYREDQNQLLRFVQEESDRP